MSMLDDIRQKYPQYNNMDDGQLADALHKKFYSDMPYGDFTAKIGMVDHPNEAARGNREQSAMGTAVDAGKSLGVGLGEGAIGLAGLPGDLQNLAGRGERWLLKQTGLTSPEAADQYMNLADEMSGRLPTSEEIRKPIESVTGKFYEPKTTAGDYAHTIGQFAPAAAGGPASLARKAAMTVIPAVASESAGQLTKGTEAEPYARAGAAIVTGIASAGRGASALKEAAQTSPKEEAISATTNALYDKLRGAGIKYDANAYEQFVKDLATKLKAEGFRDKQAPRSADTMNYLVEHVGTSPDFNDFESMRRTAGKIIGEEKHNLTDVHMAKEISKGMDKFAQRSPFMTNGSVPADKVGPLMKEARDWASRNIKIRILNEAIDKAKTYQSGFESGLRNQFSNLLRSGRSRSFSPAERDAIQQAAKGTFTSNALGSFGRLGFDFSNMGARGILGPLAATGAALYEGGGNLLHPAMTLAGATAAKYAARKMTEKAAGNAKNVVGIGRDAQDAAMARIPQDREKALIRQMLMLDNGLNAGSSAQDRKSYPQY